MGSFAAAFALVVLHISGFLYEKDDVQCVRDISDVCSKELWGNKEELVNMDYCGLSSKMFTCIRKGLVECHKDELVDDADHVLANTREICQNATHLTDELKAHFMCIMRAVSDPKSTPLHCLSNVLQAVSDVRKDKTEENILKFNSIGCNSIEPTKECIFKAFKDSCGEDAESFIRRANEPVMDFHKRVCDVMDNKASLMMIHYDRPH